MRSLLILGSLIAGALQEPNPLVEGPVFDAEGHYIAYNYADGTHDWYTYDSSWRLIQFEGRDGRRTFYVYKPDGTMQAIPEPAKLK